MNHAIAVGVAKGRQHFAHDALHLRQGESLIGFKVVAQFFAFDKLHRDKGNPLLDALRVSGCCHHGVVVFCNDFAVVINSHNVRVIQSAGRLRLSLESGHGALGLALTKLLWQYGFDSYHPLNDGVKTFIHHAHGTFAQFASN